MRDYDFIEITTFNDCSRRFISTCGNLKMFKPPIEISKLETDNDFNFEENVKIIEESYLYDNVFMVICLIVLVISIIGLIL